MDSRLIGSFGETQAVKFLRDKRYDILACNYRCRMGEIDIIAKEKNYLVFCEVKTRTMSSIATPLEYVDSRKQRKLLAAASLFIMQSKNTLQPRFDVIEVFVEYSGGMIRMNRIHHLENAFSEELSYDS